jgi:hypothetical protein
VSAADDELAPEQRAALERMRGSELGVEWGGSTLGAMA